MSITNTFLKQAIKQTENWCNLNIDYSSKKPFTERQANMRGRLEILKQLLNVPQNILTDLTQYCDDKNQPGLNNDYI